MMDSQNTQALIAALERYFDEAEPDDDAHNAAISRTDRERYGAELLTAAPFIILDRLRQMVIAQTLSLRDDAEADSQLVDFGLYHLVSYASLIKAFGAGDVASISILLPTLQDEDAAALAACALGLLADSSNPMIRIAVQSAASTLQQDIRRAYNTAYQVALAYFALRCGMKDVFKSTAIPQMTTPDQVRSLERMLELNPKRVEGFALSAIVMHIASQGRDPLSRLMQWRRR